MNNNQTLSYFKVSKVQLSQKNPKARGTQSCENQKHRDMKQPERPRESKPGKNRSDSKLILAMTKKKKSQSKNSKYGDQKINVFDK